MINSLLHSWYVYVGVCMCLCKCASQFLCGHFSHKPSKHSGRRSVDFCSISISFFSFSCAVHFAVGSACGVELFLADWWTLWLWGGCLWWHCKHVKRIASDGSTKSCKYFHICAGGSFFLCIVWCMVAGSFVKPSSGIFRRWNKSSSSSWRSKRHDILQEMFAKKTI